ncbi:MAG: hypothetical protein D4S02_04980 [Rhodocyclaceae bacterium]|nr:MAG: hypothetical protein D4S02_04980 [Rhodocyclaceae bacterium]
MFLIFKNYGDFPIDSVTQGSAMIGTKVFGNILTRESRVMQSGIFFRWVFPISFCGVVLNIGKSCLDKIVH